MAESVLDLVLHLLARDMALRSALVVMMLIVMIMMIVLVDLTVIPVRRRMRGVRRGRRGRRRRRRTVGVVVLMASITVVIIDHVAGSFGSARAEALFVVHIYISFHTYKMFEWGIETNNGVLYNSNFDAL
jgi:hypothetical protein